VELSGQLHAPGCVTPGETFRRNHSTGGCVGPKAGLFVVENRRISCPCRESNSKSSDLQPVVRRCTDWAIPAPLLRPRVTSTTCIYKPPTSQFITIVTSLFLLNTVFMLCWYQLEIRREWSLGITGVSARFKRSPSQNISAALSVPGPWFVYCARRGFVGSWKCFVSRISVKGRIFKFKLTVRIFREEYFDVSVRK
jgi:hypothetical protein